MNKWQEAANIATVVGVPIAVAAASVAAYQLRRQTKIAQAANAQSLVTLAAPFNMQIMTNDSFARLWLQLPDAPESLSAVKEFQHTYQIRACLMFYENVVHQFNAGLLEKDLFASWRADLKEFIKKHNLAARWPEFQPTYSKEFNRLLQDIFRELSGTVERRSWFLRLFGLRS